MIELKEFANAPTFRTGSLGSDSRKPVPMPLPLRSESSASDRVSTVPLLGSTREEVLEGLRQREIDVSELYADADIQEAMNRLLSEGRATKEEHPSIWTAPVAQAFGGLVRRLREDMVNRRRFPTIQEESRSEKDDIFIRVYKDPREQLQVRLNESAWQFDVDFRDFCRLLAGWLCIAFACHGPWFAAAGIYVVQEECGTFVSYFRGFLIFNAVAVSVNALLSLAQSVDQGKSKMSVVGPWISFLLSVALMAYNLLGVILVWSNTPQSTDCNDARALAIALVVVFLGLPCLCAVLQAWVIPKQSG